jgi:hypothetical protein
MARAIWAAFVVVALCFSLADAADARAPFATSAAASNARNNIEIADPIYAFEESQSATTGAGSVFMMPGAGRVGFSR